MKGYCAPYNGNVCRNYINGRGLVWFNISQDNAGGWRNEEITMAIRNKFVASGLNYKHLNLTVAGTQVGQV